MSEVKITKHKIEIRGVPYFRDDAQSVRLGSYGKKQDPVGPAARLQVEGHIKPEHMKGRVHCLGGVKVDWSRTTKVEVEGAMTLKLFGLDGKVASTTTFEKIKELKAELVEFAFEGDRAVKNTLNDASAARRFMADEGQDARVVTRILVLMSGELTERISVGKTVEVSVGKGDQELEISAGIGADNGGTLTFSTESTFGFTMHKVKDWNKGKTEVDEVEDDRKGMG